MGSRVSLGPASMQKQKLMLEFNALKTASPQGVFLSLSPKDPALWTGVTFVRNGPYQNAILRFTIRFPALYPSVPPLLTFTTDIFHPLLAPLTVSSNFYTSPEDGSTGIIILDDERLPPGGFSLRHGFPSWFRRSRGQLNSSQFSPRTSSLNAMAGGSSPGPGTPVRSSPGPGNSSKLSPPSIAGSAVSSPGSTASRDVVPVEGITMYEVLRYVRSTFDDATVLDGVPLKTAGNSGAWHAWRAHRASENKSLAPKSESNIKNPVQKSDVPLLKTPFARAARQPGEWNWDGVWQVRAKKGIDLSVSEAALYGNSTTSDELINFLPPDSEALEAVKHNMEQSVDDQLKGMLI